jgi:hypothetical protein
MPSDNFKRVSTKIIQRQTKSNMQFMLQSEKDSQIQVTLKKTQMEGTKGVPSNAQAKAIGGKKGQEGKLKKEKNNLKKKPKKQNNIANDKICYATKKGHHS